MAKLQLAESRGEPMTLAEEECGLLDEDKPPSQVKAVKKIWGLRGEVALITAALCGVVLGFALALLFPMLNAQPKATREGTQSDLVQLPIESVVFRRNQSFIDPPSPESNVLWESLIPGNGSAHGFATIENPEQYGLPMGAQKGPNRQSFGVSMYHQLHCLMSIRDIFWGLLTGKYNAADFEDNESDLHLRIEGHTGHCFDYLRQGIQCASDITFEGIAEGTEQTFTGWNMEHKNCRSFSAARAFMEAHTPESAGKKAAGILETD